jgi:hypothetical protein
MEVGSSMKKQVFYNMALRSKAFISFGNEKTFLFKEKDFL